MDHRKPQKHFDVFQFAIKYFYHEDQALISEQTLQQTRRIKLKNLFRVVFFAF